MAGHLGQEKSISVEDLQKGSGNKSAGSDQPSSYRKKSKKEIDKRKKVEFIIKLEVETEELKQNNCFLQELAEFLKVQLYESRKEINRLILPHQATLNKSIEELQQTLIASDEHYKIEMKDLKGSVQPSCSCGKKSKKERQKKYYDKKKAELIMLKGEIENIKENNWRLEGLAEMLKTQLEERRKEITSLITDKAELQQKCEIKMNALKAKHAKELKREINALKELKREMNALKVLKREMNALKAECAPVMLPHREMNIFKEPDVLAQDDYFMEHVYA